MGVPAIQQKLSRRRFTCSATSQALTKNTVLKGIFKNVFSHITLFIFVSLHLTVYDDYRVVFGFCVCLFLRVFAVLFLNGINHYSKLFLSICFFPVDKYSVELVRRGYMKI